MILILHIYLEYQTQCYIVNIDRLLEYLKVCSQILALEEMPSSWVARIQDDDWRYRLSQVWCDVSQVLSIVQSDQP